MEGACGGAWRIAESGIGAVGRSTRSPACWRSRLERRTLVTHYARGDDSQVASYCGKGRDVTALNDRNLARIES
jgi:hypothetical protein